MPDAKPTVLIIDEGLELSHAGETQRGVAVIAQPNCFVVRNRSYFPPSKGPFSAAAPLKEVECGSIRGISLGPFLDPLRG
jgi:hypothetical protein